MSDLLQRLGIKNHHMKVGHMGILRGILGQEELSHVLFPLGEWTKAQVRAIAARYDLPTLPDPRVRTHVS
jgi:ATP phosphoribosyltransferase regulatory subunit HisZ